MRFVDRKYIAAPAILTAIWVIGLCFLLSGCFATTGGSQQPVPEEFLAECRALDREIRTNGDLAKALKDHKEALAACNLDKKAIRHWSDGLME
jgi:hypothetical protein